MRVTAADVAKKAGVSVSTVSRALGSPALVAAPTRERVEQASQELGYLPNPSAQNLASGRTGTIGLVVSDLENPHFSALAKGIQGRARELGHAVLIVDTDEDPAVEVEVLGSLAHQVDGVIVCSARASDDAVRRYAERTTLVLINRTLDGIASVVGDEIGGSREIMRHLAALGHRTVACAKGPRQSWTSAQRLIGLQRAADELDLHDVIDLGAFRPDYFGGVAVADLLLASPATAVVVHNDLMAVGVLRRLAERGVGVPGEFSVVSHDDILIAAAFSPSLTSVRSSAKSVSRAATALLLELLRDGENAQHHQVIPMDLQVRASTGPVRAHPNAVAADG